MEMPQLNPMLTYHTLLYHRPFPPFFDVLLNQKPIKFTLSSLVTPNIFPTRRCFRKSISCSRPSIGSIVYRAFAGVTFLRSRENTDPPVHSCGHKVVHILGQKTTTKYQVTKNRRRKRFFLQEDRILDWDAFPRTGCDNIFASR